MSQQAPPPIVRKWFQPGEGIAREVITADIQRYLGPDALVKPGVGQDDMQGVQGYWITAYRGLTSSMVDSLRKDTERWHTEVKNHQAAHRGRIAEEPERLLQAYVGSEIHIRRQNHGPPNPGHPPHYPTNNLPPDIDDGGYVDRHPMEYRHPGRYESSPNYQGPGAHGTPPPQAHQYPGGHPPMNSGYNGHPNAGNTQQGRPPPPPPQPMYYQPEPEYYPPQPVMGHGEIRNAPPRNGGPPHSHYPVNPPMREPVYTQGSSNPPHYYNDNRVYAQQPPPQPNSGRSRR